MEKVCFSCKQAFALGSLKTSRSRFKLMGINPPEGMGISDKICNKCLQEMYDKQIKQDSVKKLKRNMTNDLLSHKKENLSSLPKKIGLEKKKKVFQ
jgi:glycogen synthase